MVNFTEKALKALHDAARNELLEALEEFVAQMSRAEDGCLGDVVDSEELYKWIAERQRDV